MSVDLNRRNFLKHAGTGTVALAGASAWAAMASSLASADDRRDGIGFFFAAVNSAGPVHNPASPDALLMQGCGHFDPRSGHIRGSGFFVHYDGSSPLSPKPIKSTGFWRARHLESFDQGPHFGVQLTGIMIADVEPCVSRPSRKPSCRPS